MAAPNRYSTLITWVKIILPLAAIGLLSTLFLFSGRPNPEDALIVQDFDIEQMASEQRLGAPRFAGTLEDGREILFAAESAAPVADAPDRFTADGVSARLALDDTQYAVLNAADALIDMGTDLATLTGGVLITRTDGMRLTTDTLVLGLQQLRAEAPGPISAEGGGLTLDAGAMLLSEETGAQILSFTGGVRVVYAGRD